MILTQKRLDLFYQQVCSLFKLVCTQKLIVCVTVQHCTKCQTVSTIPNLTIHIGFVHFLKSKTCEVLQKDTLSNEDFNIVITNYMISPFSEGISSNILWCLLFV